MIEPSSFALPAFRGVIGVARADITPPVGIYARNWGAALHDVAEAVHRPLTLTVLTLQTAPDSPPHVLAAADLGWWRDPADEWFVRGAVLEVLGLPAEQFLLAFSHTHAGPVLCREDAEQPGGERIAPYLEQLRDALVTATKEALATSEPAVLEFTTGSCSLARHRDERNPTLPERFLCGYDSDAEADNTLLVGRVTNDSGRTIATLVNYACHPTTLAHENRFLSPDFVGAMREVVEGEIGGFCLFLQGASGELAPREQYTADLRVADKNGRQLGFATLEAISGMLPPGTGLRFSRVVESGAPLAVWEPFPRTVTQHSLRADIVFAEPGIKPEWRETSSEEREWEIAGDPASVERLRRRRRTRKALGNSLHARIPIWLWQTEDVLLVAHPTEAYSLLQKTLRTHFPRKAVLVMNVTNGWYGYLPPAHLYRENIYSVWQTPFAVGGLEHLIDTCLSGIVDNPVGEKLT